MRSLALILLIFGSLRPVWSSTCQISTQSEANDFEFVYSSCLDKIEVNNTYPLNFSSVVDEQKLNSFLLNKEAIYGGVLMMHSTEIKRLHFPKLKRIGLIEGHNSLQIIGNPNLKDLFFFAGPTFGGSVIVRGNRYLSLKSINRLRSLFRDETHCDLQEFHEFFCYASDIIEEKVKGCVLALGDFIFNAKNPLEIDHLESFRSLRVVKGKIQVTASETANIQHFSLIENITSESAEPALFISIEGLQKVNLSRLHHISSAGRIRLDLRNYQMSRKEYDQLVARLGGSEGLVVGVSKEETTQMEKGVKTTEVWEASNLALVLTCFICFLIIALVLGLYICIAIRKRNIQERNEKAASQRKEQKERNSQKTSQKSSGEKSSDE